MQNRTKYRKGQAALEYLITYGWALIIIIGIITLLYSYIFKPEFYVVESCSMAPGIECGTFTLTKSADGNNMILDLILKSEMNFNITIQEFNLTTTNFLDSGEVIYSWNQTAGCYSPYYCTANIKPTAVAERSDFSAVFSATVRSYPAPRPATLQRMKFAILYKIVETGSIHRTAGILNVKVS